VSKAAGGGQVWVNPDLLSHDLQALRWVHTHLQTVRVWSVRGARPDPADTQLRYDYKPRPTVDPDRPHALVALRLPKAQHPGYRPAYLEAVYKPPMGDGSGRRAVPHRTSGGASGRLIDYLTDSAVAAHHPAGPCSRTPAEPLRRR
jgi:hypothetical protein